MISEESPEMGDPVLARSIYENLKRIDEEQTQEMMCATAISTSDISVTVVDSSNAEEPKKQLQRPKSSAA